MTADLNQYFARAMNLLEETGLLLHQGREIPDVCGIITSHQMKGSWWGNPRGPEIFAVGEFLSDHPDVTITKLVNGKVTYVHRTLWPKLVAVGRARDDWQTQGLSAEAKLLLRELDKSGSARTDNLGPKFGSKPSNTATELELRLLIHSEQFHTETGYHTKLLETWEYWATRVKLRNKSLESWRALNFFEKRIKELNENRSGQAQLPWQAKKLLKVKRS